jgi:hypothetical protein
MKRVRSDRPSPRLRAAWAVLLIALPLAIGCGGAEQASVAPPDPAAGSSWDEMSWDDGSWA